MGGKKLHNRYPRLPFEFNTMGKYLFLKKRDHNHSIIPLIFAECHGARPQEVFTPLRNLQSHSINEIPAELKPLGNNFFPNKLKVTCTS